MDECRNVLLHQNTANHLPSTVPKMKKQGLPIQPWSHEARRDPGQEFDDESTEFRFYQ